MKGILINCNERPDVVLTNGGLLGGLHCGDCFNVLKDGKWVAVRLELDEEWVLFEGKSIIPIPYGSEVEI